MSLTRRAALAGGGLAMLTGLPAVSHPALAQAAYPSRTIKMIVPYPAGGTTDFLGRLVADQLKTGLGATVIVENKPRGRHHARRRSGGKGGAGWQSATSRRRDAEGGCRTGYPPCAVPRQCAGDARC